MCCIHHILGWACIGLIFFEYCMSDVAKLCCLVVHPYSLSICGDCVLFVATIDPPSEFEEGYEGDTFAGEDQEEPGTTGKPPLSLAFFYTYIACMCFGCENALYSNDGVPGGTSAFLFYHLSGCSLSVAPILSKAT